MKRDRQLMRRVASNVRRLRLRARLTQDQLGKRIGMQGEGVSRIEGGGENLTLQSLSKLARALRRPVTSLFHEN